MAIDQIGTNGLVASAIVPPDGSISTAKIANDAVTSAKIGNDAVTSAKIGVDVIAAEDLANNSVTVAELSNDAVTTVKIADNAVTSAKINSITSVQATENVPMFEVSKSSNQSLSTTVWTKVTFNIEGADPLNHFDTTNSRYQPNVAGWYQITFNPSFQGNGGSLRYASIMKNTDYKVYAEVSGTTAVRVTVSGLIYLNGSSDYIEFKMYTQATSSVAIRGGANETQASGFLVRAD